MSPSCGGEIRGGLWKSSSQSSVICVSFRKGIVVCPAIDFFIAEHHAKQFLRVPATRGADRLVFLFVETLAKSEGGVLHHIQQVRTCFLVITASVVKVLSNVSIHPSITLLHLIHMFLPLVI